MSRTRERRILFGVGVKLGSGLVVLLLLMAFLAWYSSSTGRAALVEGVGVASEAIAESLSATIDTLIYERGHEVLTSLNGYGAFDAARASNAVFDAMEDPQAYIDEVDLEWTTSPEDEVPDTMQAVLESNLSLSLRQDLIDHYLEHHGWYVYGDTIVTNAYGAVIGTTHRPADYRQDDETWWQSSLNERISFSDVVAGENSGVYGIWVCIPMTEEDGTLLGVFRTTVNILFIANDVGLTDLGYETSEIKVTTSDGRLLYSTRAYVMLQDVSSSGFFQTATDDRGHFIEVESDADRLFSYVRSTGYMEYGGNAWVVFLSHSEAEVLKSESDLEAQILVGAASAIFVAVVVSVFLSRSLTRPIVALTAAARDMAEGKLDRRVAVKRKDELGTLAESFNIMAGELQLMYAGLDALVKERTRELESANKKLSILGSITRHDALNHLTLQKGWLEMAARRSDDPQLKEYLGKIGTATDNLVEFLQFTSDYERVGLGKPEWVGLGEAIESATAGLELANVALTSTLEGVEVYADPMFPKVLHNLIGNSLKHGGKVTKIAFSSSDGPDGAIIVYEDDGTGIPTDQKEGLFERQGTQGERSHGMFLSAEILRMTGISIKEVGVPGEGARFEIHVPRDGYRAAR